MNIYDKNNSGSLNNVEFEKLINDLCPLKMDLKGISKQ